MTSNQSVSNETPDLDGAALFDRTEQWLKRFLVVIDPLDLKLLVLWIVGTHLALELYTTPRLLLDSSMPGAGKTTALDHMSRLTCRPVQMSAVSSSAMLVRVLENGIRTILIDEVDKSLRPDKPGVADIIAILNSGYRRGATRPVLVPTKGGGWETREMPTFAPCAMAGISPHLPDDTKSRSIRILLMPDLDGAVEDSDWEFIEDEAADLRAAIEEFADAVRESVSGMKVDLPAGCIGRAKEKWRPLKRVAVAAGGHWPAIADQLIRRSLDEDADERDAGLRTLPVGMVLMADLHAVWPNPEPIDGTVIPTRELVAKLIVHNPEYWGVGSSYGKELTDTRLGRMVAQASKITSQRPGGRGPRGYLRVQFEPVWHRLGIGRIAPGAPGEPGWEPNRDNRPSQVHQVETGGSDLGSDPPQPGTDDLPSKRRTPAKCPNGCLPPARDDSGLCDWCTARKHAVDLQLANLTPDGERA